MREVFDRSGFMEEIKPTSLFTSLAEAVKFGARLHAVRTGELPCQLPSLLPSPKLDAVLEFSQLPSPKPDAVLGFSQLPSPKLDAVLGFSQLPSPKLDAVLGLEQQQHGPGAVQITTDDTGPLQPRSQPGSPSDMDITAARDEEVRTLSRSSSLTHTEMASAAAARSSIISSCRAVETLPRASVGSVAGLAPAEAARGTPARGTPPPCPAPLDDATRAQDPSSEAELSRSERESGPS